MVRQGKIFEAQPGQNGSARLTFTAERPDGAATFTSADTAQFVKGRQGSFTVTTDDPTAKVALDPATPLPAGLSFQDKGDGTAIISGTSQAATGDKPADVTVSADNGQGAVTQTLHIAVVESDAPVFTSADKTTFTEGNAGTFTVTTKSSPTAHLTLDPATPLPAGLSFQDKGDGTAVISGTPATGTHTQPADMKVIADNGGTATTQTLHITVTPPAPAFTSSDTASFLQGKPGSFTITTKADPTAKLSLDPQANQLTQGLTFTDNKNGTATISGTPATGTGGLPYDVKVIADNGTTTTQTLHIQIGI
ncbi:hypothetical protein [Streptomyces sp. NPDC058272]|uniref:hypothetical protein n=1 Tax=unclassified Streptomyces TaxID=2593676 RepID=UPI0036E445C8